MPCAIGFILKYLIRREVDVTQDFAAWRLEGVGIQAPWRGGADPDSPSKRRRGVFFLSRAKARAPLDKKATASGTASPSADANHPGQHVGERLRVPF